MRDVCSARTRHGEGSFKSTTATRGSNKRTQFKLLQRKRFQSIYLQSLGAKATEFSRTARDLIYALTTRFSRGNSRKTDKSRRLRQDELLMNMPASNSFFAHLRSSREGQLLKDHLLNVSAITSWLAAKAGIPRVGALIGVAHAPPDSLCTRPRFT